MSKTTLVCDTECYHDYWLVMFRRVDTGLTRYYECFPGQTLNAAEVRKIMAQYRIVTFNGITYDLPMIALALTGASTDELKKMSDSIIVGNLKSWQTEELFGIKVPTAWDHIDISEVAPGVMISLKQYGGRMHSKRLQDLPLPPDTRLTPEMRETVRDYCGNTDLPITIDLWNRLTAGEDDVIAIREKIAKDMELGKLDLRSKSDAQVAEAVIRKLVEKRHGARIYKPEWKAGTAFKYTPPSFVKFSSPHLVAHLQAICDATFRLKANGKISEPAMLAKDAPPVVINGKNYKMGIGGLHSMEKSVAYAADEDAELCDIDVVSFYPELIRKCGLAPSNMGVHFSAVYGGFIDKRIAAKKAGQKTVAQMLKIFLNGTFGKLGSPYSVLYAPHLLIQVTLTGQLMLLMMIERMEAAGIPVVSANTDGIVLNAPRRLLDVRKQIVKQWEHEAEFETEETQYRGILLKDVNNYYALKLNGGCKTKGEYADPSLAKNAENEICNIAVKALLEHGTRIEDTVYGCEDIRKFVTATKANGGATFDGQYLGKVVRWVYRLGETRDIRYVKANESTGNHNKVSNSDGALPVMILPDQLPLDLDYQRYIDKAYSILSDVGATETVINKLLYGANADLFLQEA